LQFLGQVSFLRPRKRRRLRLAAPLGQRLGKVGEQHGEPQPQRDGQDETGGRFTLPPRPASHRPVVRMLPTYTTNITGLRHCTRVELLKDRHDGRFAPAPDQTG
jgi:hypothetical protein